jgi:hypothetical protein
VGGRGVTEQGFEGACAVQAEVGVIGDGSAAPVALRGSLHAFAGTVNTPLVKDLDFTGSDTHEDTANR